MLAFKPPKPSVTAIQTIQALIPLVNRLYLKGLTLDVEPLTMQNPLLGWKRCAGILRS